MAQGLCDRSVTPNVAEADHTLRVQGDARYPGGADGSRGSHRMIGRGLPRSVPNGVLSDCDHTIRSGAILFGSECAPVQDRGEAFHRTSGGVGTSLAVVVALCCNPSVVATS